MGPNVKINAFLVIRGGGGMGGQLTDCAHLDSQLSSHLRKSTYIIWKQYIQDCSSYRVHEVLSAAVAA